MRCAAPINYPAASSNASASRVPSSKSPPCILADEPVASLDPASADRVLGLLHGICKADGITAIVSLHQLEFARRYADRIVALAQGRVVFDGPPRKLGKRGGFAHLPRNVGRKPMMCRNRIFNSRQGLTHEPSHASQQHRHPHRGFPRYKRSRRAATRQNFAWPCCLTKMRQR